MALQLEGYEQLVADAVRSFWHTRDIEGVRSGRTLNKFKELLEWVVINNGLPNARVISGTEARLPGYFRPTKAWDIVIINNNKLIAAVELKSIADSFGKNSNNRNEEALGSATDLQEAFAEDAFEGLTSAFIGYIILVEDCEITESNTLIQVKHFRVMQEFMAHPEIRETSYVRNRAGTFPAISGVSYMQRFDILCRRLMGKRLYDAASVIKSPRSAIADGSYSDISQETSIRRFLVSLAAHAEAESAMIL